MWRFGVSGPLTLTWRVVGAGSLSLGLWLGGPLALVFRASGGFLRKGSIRPGGRWRAAGSVISLSLVEPRAGIFVLSAGPPLAPAFLARAIQIAARPSRLFRRVPHTPAREPLHHDIRILPL